MKNAARATLRFVSLVVCALVVSSAGQEPSVDVVKAVELTSVDLFGLPGWQQRQVAVDGFVLGITRTEAFEIAKAHNLDLISDLPPRTVRESYSPCRQGPCSVTQVKGNWIGINLFFDADRLTKVKVSVPVDADPEVQQVNIVKSFKGRTYQLFNNYSDSLRSEIFGPTEGKEKLTMAGTQVSPFAKIEYEYPHAGVIVRVTIDKRDHPPEPFDLEVDFVIPR